MGIPVSRLGDSAFSSSGTGYKCRSPLSINVASASSRVYSDGIGVARGGIDTVSAHPVSGCGPDGSLIISATSRVFVEGYSAARIGDSAPSDNTVTGGSSRVIFG